MPSVQQPPEVTRWCMLFIAVACFVGTLIPITELVQSEQTGRAHYTDHLGSLDYVAVNRTQDPAKFDRAILTDTFGILLCGSVSLAAFYFYRRLS